jgi:hypothetical protein
MQVCGYKIIPQLNFQILVGENTLEAQLCRVLVRSITNSKGYDYDAFLNEYIRFMTTPGSHNDTCTASLLALQQK